MSEVATIGLDLAKNVFQVHAVDAAGVVTQGRKLRRGDVLRFFSSQPPCLVGMEACATSHYWAREIGRLGHEVRMMPPAYVKPYVKRGKTDASDAEAICEAVTRPTLRFVAIKTEDQQAVLMLHKARELLVRQHTMLTNAVRAHMAELGTVTAQGTDGLKAPAPEPANGPAKEPGSTWICRHFTACALAWCRAGRQPSTKSAPS